MKLQEELLERLRDVIFPALLVLASVVIFIVLGAYSLAPADQALAIATPTASEGTTGGSGEAPALEFTEVRAGPILGVQAPLSRPPGAPERLANEPLPSQPEQAANAASADETPDEIDRLRSQIMRVATAFPASSRSLVLVRRLASLAPAEALACLAQLPDDTVRTQSVGAIASDWVARDPAGAVAACAGFRGSSVGRQLHLEVVRELARRMPERAVSLVKSAASRDDSLALLGAVYRDWGNANPREATARALELEAGAERSELLADVMTIWAQQEMSEAARAVVALPGDGGRGACLAGVVRRLGGAGGPAIGAAFIRAVMVRASEALPERERNELAAAAVDMLGAQGLDSIRPFLDTLPEGYDRSVLLQRMVGLACNEAPERAVRYGLLFPDRKERVAAIRLAASGFVHKDESGALSWLSAVQDREDRAAATQAVFFEIGDLDLAERWLKARMGELDADIAIQSFVLRATRDDPPRAATWARQISDNSLRYFAIEAVARAWLRINRPALESWLARTDLPETRVNRLLAR